MPPETARSASTAFLLDSLKLMRSVGSCVMSPWGEGWASVSTFLATGMSRNTEFLWAK